MVEEASGFEGGFADRAEAYLESEVHREGEDLDAVVDWLEGRDRVCDVGAGPGHVAGALLERGRGWVVGLDPEVSMLRLARRTRGGLIGVAGASDAMPFDRASFDGIACRVAAHHFEDLGAFLRESHRVLAPGGVLAVVDTAAPEEDELDRWINRVEARRDPSHVRDRTVVEWTAGLRSAGFEIDVLRKDTRALNYADWVERQHPPGTVRKRLREAFLEAPDRIRDAFDVQYDGEDVASFVLPRILVRAVRR